VFRAAGIYVVAAWVGVQVASLILPAIEVPESAIRHVWLIAISLFPLALVFAWFYDLSSSGISRTAPVNIADHVDLSLRSADWIILAALAVVGLAVTWQLSASIRNASLDPQSQISSDIDPNSIAVLPLVSTSVDSGQEYFVSGMHGALISRLSRVRALKVTSKTSTLRYADISDSSPHIANELRVAKLIEGSVTRDANNVRIAVRLIDAAINQQIWSGVFEDDITNVLRMQSDIARAIADQVQAVVSDESRAPTEIERSVNPEAYEAFLKGQFHVERFTPQDMTIAAQYYQQAVELDPDYPLAWYGLSKLCGFRAQASQIPPEQAQQECLPPILRALELDPNLPEAHLGYAAHMTWQRFEWEEAATGFERAIELNPSYAEARMFYSHYLAIMGRGQESSEQMRRALELDPFNPFVRGLYGAQLSFIGDFQGSIDVLEEVMRTTPGFAFGYNVLWQSYFEVGRYDEALAAVAGFYRHARGDSKTADTLEQAYRNGDYSRAMLESATALEGYPEGPQAGPLSLGYMFEQAGEIEKAIDWYEIGVARYDPDAPYLPVVSKNPELHLNPRFIKLLMKMKHYYWAGLYSDE